MFPSMALLMINDFKYSELFIIVNALQLLVVAFVGIYNLKFVAKHENTEQELANTIINPGESKTIKLILTKTMTENNTALSNNRAEIYEQYNELGLVDIDSTPNNQAQGEDDIGAANVIISPATGAEVTYTCTILVGLVILATGIYFIKRKTARYYN